MPWNTTNLIQFLDTSLLQILFHQNCTLARDCRYCSVDFFLVLFSDAYIIVISTVVFDYSTKKSPAVHQMLFSAKSHAVCHVIPYINGTEKCRFSKFEGWTTFHWLTVLAFATVHVTAKSTVLRFTSAPVMVLGAGVQVGQWSRNIYTAG